MNARARELAEVLLDRERDPRQLRPELMELVGLCQATAPVEGDPAAGIGAGEQAAPQGLALSPPMAALCAEGYLRTLQFQRGVAQAIASRARGDRPVRVLYAGCGPWAMLVLPTLLRAGEGELEVVLLELQPASAASARRLLEAWDLERHVVNLVQGDALDWARPGGDPEPDVLVVETLQAGLFREPQVALTRHLLAQAPGAELVPRRIEVRLAVGDPAHEFSAPGPDLGVAFAVDRETVAQWRGLDGDRLPGATLRLGAALPPGATPFWRTRLEVGDGLPLEGGDSGLTTALRAELGGALVAGGQVECWYELGAEPGVRGRVLAAEVEEPRLLWVDGFAALLVGLLVVAASGPLARLYGLPQMLLLATGAANLLYASYSLPLARRPRAERPLEHVALLAGANAGWAVACMVLGVVFGPEASWFGRAHLFGEGVAVGALAALEWRWRRSLSA